MYVFIQNTVIAIEAGVWVAVGQNVNKLCAELEQIELVTFLYKSGIIVSPSKYVSYFLLW